MEDDEADELGEDAGELGQRVLATARWARLATEVITLVYVVDVVTGGKLGGAVEPYLRNVRQHARRYFSNLQHERDVTLAGRRLVWDACEVVMDADPAWWAAARGAAA